MLKQLMPIMIKNYVKNMLNWKIKGEFAKSVTRFVDHRGLQVKRFLLVPFFNFKNPYHYHAERAICRGIESSKSAEAGIFEIDRQLGFGKIELNSDDVGACVDFAQEKLSSTGGRPKNLNEKDYLRVISDLSDVEVTSRVFKLFTGPQMLQSVTKYLGSAPILSDLVVMYSPESSSTARSGFKGSQLYHRDGDGVRVLKIWILCNDVEIGNGPTVLLPAKISNKIALKHRYHPGDKIEDDVWFQRHSNDLFYAVGPTGTALATDTISCFHMGSRTSESSSRLVLMAQYVTPYSSYYRPNSALSLRGNYNFQGKISELSESARILLRPFLLSNKK
jgi:hypothetical protein